MLMQSKITQVADVSLLSWSGATHQPRARWPGALTTSLDRPGRWTAIVDRLIESALLGRSKDSVLFHPGY